MRAETRRRWRLFAKGVLASGCYPVLSLAFGKVQPFIVSYHRVVEDFSADAPTALPAMLVGRRMFEQQLDWIGRHFSFLSLDEIGARLERGQSFARPVAAITFDDGYRDVFEQARPVLLRKGIPATFFVVTDVVGRDSWQIFDRLYHVLQRAFAVWPQPEERLTAVSSRVGIKAEALLRTVSGAEAATAALVSSLAQADVLRVIDALADEFEKKDAAIPPLLTWDMVRQLQHEGFTIGSHTRTHVWLARESRERVADELVGSKRELERQIAAPVVHFAYPGGQFTAAIAQAVTAAGYRFAYTLCRHRDAAHSLTNIPRELLWENSAIDAAGRFAPAVMGCQVCGIFSAMNRCSQTHV